MEYGRLHDHTFCPDSKRVFFRTFHHPPTSVTFRQISQSLSKNFSGSKLLQTLIPMRENLFVWLIPISNSRLSLRGNDAQADVVDCFQHYDKSECEFLAAFPQVFDTISAHYFGNGRSVLPYENPLPAELNSTLRFFLLTSDNLKAINPRLNQAGCGGSPDITIYPSISPERGNSSYGLTSPNAYSDHGRVSLLYEVSVSTCRHQRLMRASFLI